MVTLSSEYEVFLSDRGVLLDLLHRGGGVELPPAGEPRLLPGGVQGRPDGEQHADRHEHAGLPGGCKGK